MAISGHVGAIYKASGTSVAFTASAMTNSGDNLRYYITDTAKRYWDNTKAVTVEKSTDGGTNWVIVTTGFTIEYAGGHVVFSVSQGTALFRVSASNFTAAQIGGGFNWTVDIEADTLECTDYEAAGWRKFVSGHKGFTGSFEMYWANGTNLSELGSDVILVLYVDSGANKYRYEGYAKVNTNGIETPTDDLVTETLDFQGAGEIYYRAG